MLTKTDLSQIQKIVQQEGQDIRKEVKQDIRTEIQEARQDLRAEIQAEFEPIKKDLKHMKSNIRRIRKTTDIMSKLLDKEQMTQAKQIRRIEQHLNLPAPQ